MFHGLDHILGHAYFALFAFASILCAFGILLSKHPLNAAIYLIGVMLSISGLYALLASPFLGVIQVLVYAGAIMMLVVFVIMVLNRARDHVVPRFDWSSLVAGILPLLLLVKLSRTIMATSADQDPQTLRGDIAPIAQTMFDVSATGGGYWLLFEIVGVLLLVAIVAAVLLAKRHLDVPVVAAPAPGDEDAHGHH